MHLAFLASPPLPPLALELLSVLRLPLVRPHFPFFSLTVLVFA